MQSYTDIVIVMYPSTNIDPMKLRTIQATTVVRSRASGLCFTFIKIEGHTGKTTHSIYTSWCCDLFYYYNVYNWFKEEHLEISIFVFNIDVKRRCAVEYDAFKEIDDIVIGLIVGSKINKDVVSHGGLWWQNDYSARDSVSIWIDKNAWTIKECFLNNLRTG